MEEQSKTINSFLLTNLCLFSEEAEAALAAASAAAEAANPQEIVQETTACDC